MPPVGAAKSKKKTRKPSKLMSNEKLLRLARKQRPPQSWYDENVNPFQPKPPAK
jgi:hypothetical protein